MCNAYECCSGRTVIGAPGVKRHCQVHHCPKTPNDTNKQNCTYQIAAQPPPLRTERGARIQMDSSMCERSQSKSTWEGLAPINVDVAR